MRCGVLKVFQTHANEKRAVVKRLSFNQLLKILSNVQQAITFRCTTLNHLRVNIKHFLGPILDAEVAQKCAPFPAVVTITEMDNANICILCDVVKKV